ncbi:MAG: hypothetical protein ABR552_05735, partial [Actinomycetota bacterium]
MAGIYNNARPLRAQKIIRKASAALALAIALVVFLSSAAVAAMIQTDLYIYQNGDTVNVTGTGFGASEVVGFRTTDPNEVVVDAGSATSDESGNVAYSFVLNATTGGIYTVNANGESSGDTASTTFDPPPARDFKATIQPNSVARSTTTTYTVTVDNKSSNASKQLGCVKMTVDSHFTGVGNAAIVAAIDRTTDVTGTWSASSSGQVVTASSSTQSARLQYGTPATGELRFSFSAASPSSSTGSPFTFTTVAFSDTACTKVFDGSSPSPTVSVSAVTPTTLTSVSGSGAYGGTGSLTATLSPPVSGKTISFSLDSRGAVGSATTDASGIAILAGVSMTGYDAGTWTNEVDASFAGDATYSGSTGTGNLVVGVLNQTITVTTAAPSSAIYGHDFSVAATAPGGAVAITSSGGCSGSGSGSATITMTSGTTACVVDFNQPGGPNYNAAPQVEEITTAAKAGQTITFTSSAPSSAVTGDQYTPTASGGASGNPVTFGTTGVCSYDSGSGKVTMSSSGSCTVTADQAGNGDYNAASQAAQVFSVGHAAPTFTFDLSTLPSKTYGDSAFPIGGYASSNSPGVITFALGAGSVGCSVTPAGQVT